MNKPETSGMFYSPISEKLRMVTFATEVAENKDGKLNIAEKDILRNFNDFYEAVDSQYNPEIPRFITSSGFSTPLALKIVMASPERFKACVLVNPLLEFAQ